MSASSIDYEHALAAAGLGDIQLFHRHATGSTSDDARAIASSEAWSGVALVIAETQTQGRGRGSNVWNSPEGSISMTLTIPGVEVAQLSVVSLGVGVAVVGALRLLGAAATVKWPNDVLINEAKVCGILCESSLLSGTARVFVGIGINVDGATDSLGATAHATTLAAHRIEVDRPALVADLTARVLSLIRGTAPPERVVADWKAVSVPWWGESVTLREGEVEQRVTLLDVSPVGHLIVRDEAGAVRSLVAGEVRQLRPVRG